jgi:HEAT repeat protein
MNNHQALLREAVLREDPDAFEQALGECFRSGHLQGLCELLAGVLAGDWHFRHEDVVRAIQDLRCAEAVPALERRAVDCPQYLAWDENWALARKCSWALADIGTEEAKDALLRLSTSGIEKIEGFAQKRLDHWNSEMSRKTTNWH